MAFNPPLNLAPVQAFLICFGYDDRQSFEHLRQYVAEILKAQGAEVYNTPKSLVHITPLGKQCFVRRPSE